MLGTFRRAFAGQWRPTCGNFEGAALNELVAQLVEQRPFKAWVLGSSPSGLTTHSGRGSLFNLISFWVRVSCARLRELRNRLSKSASLREDSESASQRVHSSRSSWFCRTE